MKKFLSLCTAFLFALVMAAGFCATASAALKTTTVLSPVATTVDSDNDNTKRTRKYRRETTTYADSRDDPNSPDYTGKGGGKKTTKNYGDNEGRDDPNSPNYTGNRTPSSDNSSHSPDTAANSSVVCIAAMAVCAAVTVGALSCKKKD